MALPLVSTDSPLDGSSMDSSVDDYFPSADKHRKAEATVSTSASMSKLSQQFSSFSRKKKQDKSTDDDGSANEPSSSKHRATRTTNVTDAKTGIQFLEVWDRDSRVLLHYLCPKHPNLKISNKGDLSRHLQSREHQPPGYCCVTSCGKKFTRLDALKRHVRNTILHAEDNLVIVEHENGADTQFG
jgi:uncharacterized Zn-finger protein